MTIGHGADSSFLAVSPQVTLVIKPVVCCHYFPPRPWLLFQPKRSPPWPVQNYTAWWQKHTGVAQGHCTMVNCKNDAQPIAPPRHLMVYCSLLYHAILQPTQAATRLLYAQLLFNCMSYKNHCVSLLCWCVDVHCLHISSYFNKFQAHLQHAHDFNPCPFPHTHILPKPLVRWSHNLTPPNRYWLICSR